MSSAVCLQVYDYEQVIDETFNDPRHKKAAAPGSCEHMDMCPIASTAKLKRRCQEGKRDCEPARSCRPCHEHGFWAGVRKLFGLQVGEAIPKLLVCLASLIASVMYLSIWHAGLLATVITHAFAIRLHTECCELLFNHMLKTSQMQQRLKLFNICATVCQFSPPCYLFVLLCNCI